MKKYIIFGWACGIAGGQIYTDNKCRTLNNKGYEVILFYGENGQIVLSNISNCKSKQYLNIAYLPAYFSNREIDAVINNMVHFVNPQNGDEIFIESNDVSLSYWAEILSQELHCKHYLFALEGFFNYKHKKDYLWFKLNRAELAGTRLTSLPFLFDGKLAVDDVRNKHYRALCTNSVQDVSPQMNINENDYDIIIGYIGRTSKPCFKYIIEGICPFVEKYSDKKILIFCIGGVENEVICRYLSQYNNCRVVFTGAIFPIPAVYFKKMTVAIGSSGSAVVAARENVRTIKYLDDAPLPLGVIGYDIRNLSEIKRMYDGTLSQLLEDIIFNNYCDRYTYQHLFSDLNNEIIDEYLYKISLEMQNSCASTGYYETQRITDVGIYGKLKSLLFRNRVVCLALNSKLVGGKRSFSNLLMAKKQVWEIMSNEHQKNI